MVVRADRVATVINTAKVTADTDGKSDQAVTLNATDREHKLIDSSGEAAGRIERLDYKIIVYVDWKGGDWTVVDSFMIT